MAVEKDERTSRFGDHAVAHGPGSKGPRLHHVAVHVNDDHGRELIDDVVVFGTELDALRFMLGKPGWVYKTLANGQQFGEVNVL